MSPRGGGDVDDKTWDDAFSKLAKALTGRKDVATVVQRSRMGHLYKLLSSEKPTKNLPPSSPGVTK